MLFRAYKSCPPLCFRLPPSLVFVSLEPCKLAQNVWIQHKRMSDEGALADWQWQDERTTDMMRDLRNCEYLTLQTGDAVWPLWNTLPRPTARPDGTAWQHGQNLTTAKYGWHPTNLVVQPPEHLLHESQTRMRAQLNATPTAPEQTVEFP